MTGEPTVELRTSSQSTTYMTLHTYVTSYMKLKRGEKKSFIAFSETADFFSDPIRLSARS